MKAPKENSGGRMCGAQVAHGRRSFRAAFGCIGQAVQGTWTASFLCQTLARSNLMHTR